MPKRNVWLDFDLLVNDVLGFQKKFEPFELQLGRLIKTKVKKKEKKDLINDVDDIEMRHLQGGVVIRKENKRE